MVRVRIPRTVLQNYIEPIVLLVAATFPTIERNSKLPQKGRGNL